MTKSLTKSRILIFGFWAFLVSFAMGHRSFVISPLHAAQATGQLRIAAASDLKFALDEIIVRFTNQNPRCTVKTSYGASGNLFAQIQNGAPFDIFFSADTNYPHRLLENGHATNYFIYAEGHLAVWVLKRSPIDVEKRGLQSLLDPSIRKIAIANPAHAPYGRAAVAALKDAGLYERVSSKFVLGENVAQTAHFIQSGGADIGIIALSLARSPALSDQGRHRKIPSRLEQAAILLRRSSNPNAARAFREAIRSPEARSILERYGLTPK
ncbi:MAG: molybdate ABC transporter substrate-binding protein [Verrucomicrobia subdivision 3 bacterium]|nr:molybdate ABC transporter substrate-binding protein [Limisphaerales bacterium]